MSKISFEKSPRWVKASAMNVLTYGAALKPGTKKMSTARRALVSFNVLFLSLTF